MAKTPEASKGQEMHSDLTLSEVLTHCLMSVLLIKMITLCLERL